MRIFGILALQEGKCRFFLQNQNVENLKSEQNFQNTNIKSNVVHARARRSLWALPIISVKRHPRSNGHCLGTIVIF